MTAIMPKDEAQKLLDEVSDSRHWVKSGRALKEMQNAAPNLARSLLAAHDEMERKDRVIEAWREDLTNERHDRDRLAADNARLAAQVEALTGAVTRYHLALDRRENGTTAGYRLQDDVQSILGMPWVQGAALEAAAAEVRALAPTDGLARLAELRAELFNTAERLKGMSLLADEYQADRDRLAADNARLAAQVEALTGALKEAGDYLEACKVNGLPDLGAASRMPFLDDVIANVDAALTLARSLIAAHDEIERLRADAQAAVSLVVEQAAERMDCVSFDAPDHWDAATQNEFYKIIVGECLAWQRAIRALAPTPTDGLALVAELRADNARLAAQVQALTGALERVGSGEGMTGTFAIRQNTQEGSELMARMKYARAALEAAALSAMTPAERADYDLTMRIRGAAGDIAKAQIAAREDGE